MPRPLMQWSIVQLEQTARSADVDARRLREIVDELGNRNSQRARKLLAEVEERLAASGRRGGRGGEVAPPAQPVLPGLSEPSTGAPSKPARPAAPGGRGQDGDPPPDDRKRPSTTKPMRPPGTAGLPDAFQRDLDPSFALPVAADADLPVLYAAALGALIQEMKRADGGADRHPIRDGQRLETAGPETLYAFPFPESGEAELFEEAKVEVETGGRRIGGSIASIAAGRIVIALEQDIGDTIELAVLIIDRTALLEALKQKIEAAGGTTGKLNRDLADAVVGRKNPPAAPPPIPRGPQPGGLNAQQDAAFRRVLEDSITWIWGPPGTGKTHTLAPAVRAAFEAGKRVMVVSNTNKAVDQILLRICRDLGEDHPAMAEGRIVRVGRIALADLEDWAPYVTVNGIAERLSVELVAEREQLQRELAPLAPRRARLTRLLADFAALDEAEKTVVEGKTRTNDAAAVGRAKKETLEKAKGELEGFRAELERRRNASFVVFMRSESAILASIATAERTVASAERSLEEAAHRYLTLREAFEGAQARRDELARRLSGSDRRAAVAEDASLVEREGALTNRIAQIDAQLASLADGILSGARIIGATTTKAYLSADKLARPDLVVIDEASMVLLPAAWYVAGLAAERVVLCGDFRQIPPIIQTQRKTVHEAIGHDVFVAAGVAQPGHPRLSMLDQQHRMDDAVCRLVSRPMYDNRLVTASERLRQPPLSGPDPLDGPLVLVDTSDLWPFEGRNAVGSRYNMMHALLVRNLCWHLDRTGHLQGLGSIGVCTPYAAQRRLIAGILAGEGLESVQVGTVHAFQGDERETIVFEIPESMGPVPWLGTFLQGIAPDMQGARLVNVAVTRAQRRLIAIANLTHLDARLPSSALLRSVLYEMQEGGRVLSGSEVLALRPIDKDLAGLVGPVGPAPEAAAFGLFDERTFYPAFERDVAAATDSVVVFSGYVSPARVSALGDLFRSRTRAGVRIRCVTRPPSRNGSIPPEMGRAALDALEAVGVTVDCRDRIHEKVVVIDGRIVWHGSLNVLSAGHRTDESMTRLVNPVFAAAVATSLAMVKLSPEAALARIVEPETSRCQGCGGRTSISENFKGRRSIRCEGCDRRSGLDGRVWKRRKVEEEDSPECPKCGRHMRLRTARGQEFWGCSGYPECRGTREAA